jgi:hypothetical protein
MIFADWDREMGFNSGTVLNRRSLGWAEDEAVNTPIGGQRSYVCNDLTGKKFGRLLILGLVDPSESGHQRTTSLYKVRCDCGTEKIVPGTYFTGTTIVQSCGCSRRQPHKKNRK